MYKHRRLQIGLFYLTPSEDVYDIKSQQPSLAHALEEELKRRGLDIKKRKAILASYCNAHDTIPL